MDRSLKASMEALIKAKRGFEFEALINQLYLIKHTAEGYQPTRERGDDGAEGLIINSKTIIAAYGPDSYDEKKFVKKINDDFDDFLDKWACTYPNWKMHYNGSLSPEQIRISETLKSKASGKGVNVGSILVSGIDQIMAMIEQDFSNRQQRLLANHLGVAKELVVFDHIRSIIDDLIRGTDVDLENVKYDLKVNIQEKIELNYSEEDRKFAMDEYEELVVDGTLKKIWGIISAYENEEINSLKLRIKNEFNKEKGTFKEKLEKILEIYMNKFSSGQDDDLGYYIRGLLVYCFEQCMIGEKTVNENEKKHR